MLTEADLERYDTETLDAVAGLLEDEANSTDVRGVEDLCRELAGQLRGVVELGGRAVKRLPMTDKEIAEIRDRWLGAFDVGALVDIAHHDIPRLLDALADCRKATLMEAAKQLEDDARVIETEGLALEPGEVHGCLAAALALRRMAEKRQGGRDETTET